MRLLDRFKKWFFNETKLDIISIADLIQIPGRDYYADEPNKLDLIDRYKEEYLKILSQKRRLTTKDISCDNLVESNKMYIELILRLVMRDNFYDIENQSLLDNKIMISKLKIYLDEIVKIEDEVIERLIALSELEKGRRVPHLNRSTLKSEIDNLKVTLQILISQKTSIRNEIDSYLTHISISDNRVSPKAIEGRRDKTIRYASHIINVNRIFNEDELTDNNIYKQISIIAILETEMEKELYINRPNIAHIISRANEIKNAANLNYDETRLMKCKLLHDLDGLENELMLYDLFGKNLVTYEDWYKFYIAKFRILTFDIADNYNDWELEKRLFVYPNEIERKVYEDIIAKKRMDFFNTDRISLIKYPYLERNLAKFLSNYLKDEEIKYFEFYGKKDYHFSSEGLRLLLSLDSKEDFCRLMNRKISISSLPSSACFNDLKNQKNDGQFVFDDKVPLSTVLEVMNDRETPTYEIPTMYRCLKELYLKFQNLYGSYFFIKECDMPVIDENTPFEEVYLLPNGISGICRGEFFRSKYYERKIIEESKDKVVVMPKSLRRIEGGCFCGSSPDAKIEGIYLNDGLEKIGFDVNIKPNSKTLCLPPSLKECGRYGIDLDKTETLTFKDYKNSKLLQNPDQLANLLYSALVCYPIDWKEEWTTDDIGEDYMKTNVCARIMLKSTQFILDWKALPLTFQCLQYIILEDDGVPIIKIDLSCIPCYKTVELKKDDNCDITDEDALKFTKALLKRIKLEAKELEKAKTKKKDKK